MVKLHDGIIYLDADSPQTSFVIEFPVKQKRVIHLRDKGSKIPFHESESSVDLSLLDSMMGIEEKRTILSVEDNEEFQNFMAKQLMDSYYVLKSKSGEGALEILNSSKQVDIIICDIMMPGMDGLTFCEKVKSDLKFSHIPVILLTAKTTLQSKIDGLVIGADDYIVKPYSIDFLVARIENLLENRRKVRESYKHSPEVNFDAIVNSNADKDFLNKLIEVIQANFDDVNLDVDKLAAHMNMSRATFYRKVKSISELTPNEFIRLTRLKKAAELLRQKKYSVNEIAFIVGFNSSSYFSKCFHKQFGILPKDFN
jgi:DNA-binding response OmpR family regulator